jgi:hypothetical protein
MNKETYNYIIENADADVRKLALKGSKNILIDLAFALQQIEGRQKIRQKIPAFYNNSNIIYPKQLSLEQSSSESTACYKKILCEGKLFADITGGFGIDFYFISQNFDKKIYVEQNAALCEIVAHNLAVLSHKNYEVYNADAADFLETTDKLDWLYIDPARRDNAGRKTVLISDCTPDVVALMPLLRKKTNKIMLKLSPMLDIHQALSALPNCYALHVIATENECKEILFLLNTENQYNKDEIEIVCVNILRNGTMERFEFEIAIENKIIAPIAQNIKKYIYEPNAAIMKAGAFKSIAERFCIDKIDKNTHLYCSDLKIEHFPGRIFEVEEIFGSSKAEIKLLKNKIIKANIIARNYVLSADELRKKLALQDGGDDYLLAFKNANSENIIVHCKRLK